MGLLWGLGSRSHSVWLGESLIVIMDVRLDMDFFM